MFVPKMSFMSPAELNDALRTLGRVEVHRIAVSLASENAGDEVDAWRITMAIDRALRHSHRTRHAAHAAREASQAVQFAAAAQGIDLPDPEVTAVARGAAELARGLVAGSDVEREMLELLQHWVPLLAKV
jgi:hypothetical protein